MVGGDKKAYKRGKGSAKEELREKMLWIRRKLLSAEVEEKSLKVKKKLFDITEFREAKVILFYVSHDNEVSTEEMIKDSLKLGKKVAIPVTIKERREILLCELRDYERELKRGAFGILEPRFRREIQPGGVEVAIIPGVVFDLRGYRIGYGGGYYDKLLPKMKGSVLIGLAYEEQVIESIPNEMHDIRMNMVITDKRIIKLSL